MSDNNLDEIEELINDVAKALCQLITAHIFSSLIDSDGELFSQKMLSRTLYIVIGLFLYHIVIKKYIFKKRTKIIKKAKINDEIEELRTTTESMSSEN
jgi:preprotein translocase subunit SecG